MQPRNLLTEIPIRNKTTTQSPTLGFNFHNTQSQNPEWKVNYCASGPRSLQDSGPGERPGLEGLPPACFAH